MIPREALGLVLPSQIAVLAYVPVTILVLGHSRHQIKRVLSGGRFVCALTCAPYPGLTMMSYYLTLKGICYATRFNRALSGQNQGA